MADNRKITGDLDRPAPIAVRAGPLSMELHGADVRHIRLAGREVAQRVYMALRDQNWGTLESRLTRARLDDRGDAFLYEFTAENRKGDIAFAWQGRIEGTADGSVEFSFSGVALRDFPRARIGLCALYPWTAAGVECEVAHNDGTRETGRLPERISPHQPFMDISAIAMRFPGAGEVTTTFVGEVFEMEDQRNWTDASFKIYGTPIASPAPVTVHEGERISQSVRLHCTRAEAYGNTNPPAPDIIDLVPAAAESALPLLGVSCAIDDDAEDADFVRAVDPGLVRVYLDYTAHTPDALAAQFARALECDAPLLVQPFLRPDAADADLRHAFDLVDAAPAERIWAVSPLGQGCDVCRDAWLDACRTGGRRAGRGSDGFPVHVNRNRPEGWCGDLCVFPALPQVHSFDNVSIIDNLPGMTAVVENARAFQTAPVVLAPITFNWRSNPVAVAPEPARADDSPLPVGVDLRQQSLFGAAWLVACVQALARGSAAAAVFFESVSGWKGLRERARPDSASDDFPVRPGEVYPVAVALAWLSRHRGGTIRPLEASWPAGVGGFLVKSVQGEAVFLYNMGNRPAAVAVAGCAGTWRERVLDAGIVGRASLDLASTQAELADPHERTLAPCSLICLERCP